MLKCTNCTCKTNCTVQFVIWTLEQDILSFVRQSFEEKLIYIQKLKGLILLRNNCKRCFAPKNVADFKCTNQNVRSFYFRLKSVNQIFPSLTSMTPWWWQTSYEIKHLEIDIKTFKTISAQRSSSICKNLVIKKYLQHNHILRTHKKNLSILLLPGWPCERKLDLKLSIFQLKRRFMSVQNKMAPVFSIFLHDLARQCLRISSRGYLEKWIKVRCFKQHWKCYRAMSRFLANIFCSYCSNVERNPS